MNLWKMLSERNRREQHRRELVGGRSCFYCGAPATARGEKHVGSGWRDGKPVGWVEALTKPDGVGSPVTLTWWTCAEHYGPVSEYMFDRTGAGGGYVFEGEDTPGVRGPAYDRMREVIQGIPRLFGYPEAREKI